LEKSPVPHGRQGAPNWEKTRKPHHAIIAKKPHSCKRFAPFFMEKYGKKGARMGAENWKKRERLGCVHKIDKKRVFRRGRGTDTERISRVPAKKIVDISTHYRL
jgi:hypothetical protein